MGILEFIILDTIYILFPLIFYLFYMAYTNSLKKEEHNLLIDMVLITSLYCSLKFSPSKDYNTVFLLLNVPLLIAYLNNRIISITILSFCIIIEYVFFFGWNPLLLIMEYLLYYLLFTLCRKAGKMKNRGYACLFLGLKVVLFTAMIWMSTPIYQSRIGWVFCCYCLSLFSVSYFVDLLFEKGKELMKLHMTVKELERDTQVKTSLFKITHEIKNPIAVCKGYLDMFDVNNIEHSKKYIPIMKDEIERTLVLLQDFLSLTRVTVEKDIIDINLLLEDVLESYHLLLHSHNIRLETDMIDDEIFILGDYNRLVQVFINLVKNSIEAIGNNGKIMISCHLKENKIIIVLTDDGCGMNEDLIKRIKEPFFTTKTRGTGLGVSLSYEIIEAHSGTVTYHSKLGKGTEVMIELPTLA